MPPKSLPARSGPTTAAAAVTETTPNGPSSTNSDEMCPVCKTLRYLNKDMLFLISPECYHPMCTVCVDRLFETGPAQCPYAGCLKTLRRKQFREAFFGDLSIEREVDIRRRVAAVFNKRESDFETLRDYNDYLEMVECLIFDLTSGDEVARQKAEGKLMDWERQHKEEIEAIKRARGDEKELRRVRMQQEKDEERRRREMMAKEDAEERRQKSNVMSELIDAVANSGNAGDAEREVKIILKKRGRHNDASAGAGSGAPGAGATNLSIRGLKKATTPMERLKARERKGPYSPFQGLRLAPSRYPQLEDKGVYHHIDLERFMSYEEYKVPGYDPAEFYKRAMFEAFGGLGLVIGEDEDAGTGGRGGRGEREEGEGTVKSETPSSGLVPVKMEVE
ncbi:putative cdk-activating kinase assembly factor mat1 protein [Zalerion maritima]|uniref:RNA polymerase II transcription factor B subunit 3 n=1 Tax=Zalerion maritima TaxID=339359 RepID=A0AAD5RLY3_9PEZI|nr:putative cdk-activating kinase assembly factor mat1 protein [Zalerion maritima]